MIIYYYYYYYCCCCCYYMIIIYYYYYNKLHHIISIGLSHSNKNDSGTFSPSIKELLNKIQLKR